MAAYAAGFDQTNPMPRVGLIVAGIGMGESDSMAAIKTLPAGVTLAVSPYSAHLNRLLPAVRTNEHEYLLAVPMEPMDYPVNDPDDRFSLMTSLSPVENMHRLRAMLARFAGYVGVVNGLGPVGGERFSTIADQFDPILQELEDRGLLIVDVRPGKARLSHAWNRSVDIVVDAEGGEMATLDRQLDSLSRVALARGSALGIALLPRPVTLERVAVWASGLSGKGLVLAPVSALVAPPQTTDSRR